MLNFTEKYIQMTQDNIINGKQKMEDMHSILLVAQDDKRFMDCGLWFTETEPVKKALQVGMALTAMTIAVHPNYSRIKKQLFLRRLMNDVDYISPIGITKIDNPKLVVFGMDAWSCEVSDDPEENKLPPRERKNRKDTISIIAFERDRAKYPMLWISYVEKKQGQWHITETLKDLNENNVEQEGVLPILLSNSFELFKIEDPIAKLRVIMAKEKMFQAGLAAPALH